MKNENPRSRDERRGLRNPFCEYLVEEFESELNHAGLEGAGDGAAVVICQVRGNGLVGCNGAPNRGGEIKIGVVEDVVELGTKLDLQSFDRSRKLLVEGKVGFVEGGIAKVVPRLIAEGTGGSGDAIGERVRDRKSKGSGVDVLDVTAGRDLRVELGMDARNNVGTVEIGATERVGDGRRNLIWWRTGCR